MFGLTLNRTCVYDLEKHTIYILCQVTRMFILLEHAQLISELAIRRCVLGKESLRLFPIGPSNLPVVVAQPDEIPANKALKRVLCDCFGVVHED